jgi:choline-sulfatase
MPSPRSGAWLALLVGVHAAAAEPLYRPEEYLRSVRAARPLNVVLVVLDTTRADFLSPYGSANATPHLGRLAEEGVVFENALSVAHRTYLSLASLYTSLRPSVLRLWERPDKALSPRYVTLAEVLEAAGHETVLVGQLGAFSDSFRQGYRRVHAVREAEEFFRTVEKTIGEARRPFFLLAHYYDVHHPYAPRLERVKPETARRVKKARAREEKVLKALAEGKGLRGFSAGDLYLLSRVASTSAKGFQVLDALQQDETYFRERWRDSPDFEADLACLKDLYAAEVREADRAVGRIVEKLRASGLLDSTLVLVTADHGEQLFEHGRLGHSDLYQHTLRVPLVLRAPGPPPARRRVGETVFSIDVFPAVLEFLGVAPPPWIQGGGLKALTEVEGSPRREFIQDGGAFAVVEHPWKLLRSGGDFQLYNLRDDPDETDGVLEEQKETADRLLKEAEVLAAEDAALERALLGGDEAASPQTRELLKSLGYIR